MGRTIQLAVHSREISNEMDAKEQGLLGRNPHCNAHLGCLLNN
jgi:hypothetical protein